MRKLNIAIIALFFGLSFASCKTEYTCNCTTGYSDGTTENNSYTKKHSDKSEAQSWCDGYEESASTYATECTVSES